MAEKLTISSDPRTRKLQKSYSEGGTAFFKHSKVHSSQGFVKAAGTILALPYPTKGFFQKKQVCQGATEYSRQFQDTPVCYSSMANKPLCAYDPLAYRSRNMQTGPFKLSKHTSSIEFDDGLHFVKKRQFQTTNRTQYTGLPCDPRTNGGILAEQVANRRYLQAK